MPRGMMMRRGNQKLGASLIALGIVLIIVSIPEDLSIVALPIGLIFDLVGIILIIIGILMGAGFKGL